EGRLAEAIIILEGYLNCRAVYHFGKKKNLELMNTSFELISRDAGDWLTNIKLVEEATIGRTYLAEVKSELPFVNLRIHFTLVQRHLILSKLASLLKKRRDYVLFEADPSDDIVKRYQLEILSKNDQKRIKALKDMLWQMQMLTTENKRLDDAYLIRVNDLEFFRAVFQKRQQIVRNLFAQRNNIIRISLYPLESPSIRIVAELNETVKPKLLFEIMKDFTSEIAKLASKGYYAKQRTTGIRLYRDETVEKEKERVRKKYKFE
ncbi:MAG: hypothetical protein ACFFD4_34335, partial [Candidatus Odinarchaeota archaeon]